MTETIHTGLVRLVQFPIQEPFRTRLINAGRAAMSRTFAEDPERTPVFCECQSDAESVNDVIEELFIARGAYYPVRKGIDNIRRSK
jgi:hypothetical protein